MIECPVCEATLVPGPGGKTCCAAEHGQRRIDELEKYKAAFENLVARIDRDGGHAQAGKTLEENLKRADERVVELIAARDAEGLR